jgi:hypothetical protein
MTKLQILGGSDVGISATLRAKEVDPTTNVTVVVADRFPNYSICGLPFYLMIGWSSPRVRCRCALASS